MKRKIICIVGPTASGKTSLAVFLAKKLNSLPAGASGQLMRAGEIISADSRQVYKGLDIGTGKDLKDYQGVKYHLIDICEPGEKFTLFDWLELVRKEIENLFEQNITPIIVGGTGLYVQALIEGFVSHQPSAVSSQQKKYGRNELDEKSLEELQRIYSKFPARSAFSSADAGGKIQNSKLDLENPRRLIRAIELAQEGINPSKKKPDFDVLEIGIKFPLEVLYKKIDHRVDERFEKEQMLEEVEGLIKSKVSEQWLYDLGLEYRIISQYLILKNLSFAQMREELKNQIHHYAKRQITWFKRFPEIKWVKDKNEALKLTQEFLK